ncbi:uncharacterized protein [Amphiura filiformis]|uniref:uncharacterized protein n=1 Tax=Amphiura filiformis TaxID=82378 RepID=UPI003B22823A
MPALGKSLGLWYRVKYRSDGTYFDAQGYTLINKLQDKEKELKIGAVLSVRYSGKVEMCEIVQVGKTKKAVWQENGTSENKEQCPGNTAKKATEKTNQKSKDKTSQKSKENDINKEKDKMSKKKKEMDVKKGRHDLPRTV